MKNFFSKLLGRSSASNEPSIEDMFDQMEAAAKETPPPTFVVSAVATDPDYGYSPEKPVCVGGNASGPTYEHHYLTQLAGPEGQAIANIQRKGSCCEFDTPNGLMGRGMLDMYELEWEGAPGPKVLYLNMYDLDAPLAPVGFSPRN